MIFVLYKVCKTPDSVPKNMHFFPNLIEHMPRDHWIGMKPFCKRSDPPQFDRGNASVRGKLVKKRRVATLLQISFFDSRPLKLWSVYGHGSCEQSASWASLVELAMSLVGHQRVLRGAHSCRFAW